MKSASGIYNADRQTDADLPPVRRVDFICVNRPWIKLLTRTWFTRGFTWILSGFAMESILQLYQLAMVVLPVYGFVSLRKQIRYGGLSKRRALLHYAAMVFAPMLAYTAVYFLAIGIETMWELNLAPEEISRSFPLAIVLGLAVWLLSVIVFVAGMSFIRGAAAPIQPKQ